MAIQIVKDNKFDWQLLEKVGCFAIPAPDEMKSFLSKIHHKYMTTNTISLPFEREGKNTIRVDDSNQIIRLFILDHNEKHPFDVGYGFKEINALLKDRMNELWGIICDHYKIECALTYGHDSTGIYYRILIDCTKEDFMALIYKIVSIAK
jgi:hypothetical protein